MIRHWTSVALLPILAVAAGFAQPGAERRTDFNAWVVYWGHGASLRQVLKFRKVLSEVSVFAYQFNGREELVPADPVVTLALRRLQSESSPHSRVIVSVVNDMLRDGIMQLKSPQVVQHLLSSPQTRAAHIARLMDLAQGADGLEIDYENLRVEDLGAFPSFIAELSVESHRRGKRLAVVLQGNVKNAGKARSGTLDWSAVAASADEVKIMAYNKHSPRGRPGPISPPDWVANLTRVAMAAVPVEKLCIILPLHGFDWPLDAPGTQIRYEQVLALSARRRVSLQRDEKSHAPFLKYKDDAGVFHEVWYEDVVSAKEKVLLLESLGVRHIGFWHPGLDDSRLWEWLSKRSAPKSP